MHHDDTHPMTPITPITPNTAPVAVPAGEHPRFPVWVPNGNDPEGIDGRWLFVDPTSAELEPRLAAQALAVAELWETAGHLSYVA